MFLFFFVFHITKLFFSLLVLVDYNNPVLLDHPSVCCFYLSLGTVDCLMVSTGRYDDGPTPRRPWHCFQCLRSQILEEVCQVDGWISTTWVSCDQVGCGCNNWQVWRGCWVCFKPKWVSNELIPIFITFVPFFPFGSCRAFWEGKPLCGQSAAIQWTFFSHPAFVKLP